MGTEAQIIPRFQLFIGVETANQPVQLVIKCRALQAQFLREGLEFTRTGIFIGCAVENVDLRIIGIGCLEVGIFPIAGDRGEVQLADLGVEFNRTTEILCLACIGTTSGNINVPVECALVERGRILAQPKENRNDGVGGVSQSRRPRLWEGEGIKAGAHPCLLGKFRLDEGRCTAGLVLLRIVADHPDAQAVIGFEQELTADQIAVLVVELLTSVPFTTSL